jgi:hypothetical protein
MKRRRTFLCLLLLLACIVLPVYGGVERKIFAVDSPVYEAMQYLYVTQGMSLPSTAGPWSGDELLTMFERIDEGTLDRSERKVYEYVSESLQEELPSVSFSATAAIEAYVHANTEDYDTEEQWYYDYDERSPLLSVPFEISLGRFYGLTEFEVANMKYTDSSDEVTGTSDLYGTYVATTNFTDFVFDVNEPYRAFASFGGDGWNLEIGRDQLSWGPGTTGNFLLGEQVQYHNMGLFSAYGDRFKYAFVVSFFPHPDEIYESESLDQGTELSGTKMFMAHRFEWRLFSDRLGLAVNEAIMYQSDDGTLDLRVLNPMMFYHDYFIRSNANSIASMELDFAPAPYWNIYSQLVVDEFTFGSTESSLDDDEKHPNAIGLMLGAKTVRPVSGGMFYASLEAVYTDPYLYLRSADGDTSQSSDSDTLNFVVAIRRWYSEGLVYDQEYLGYEYGGDAVVGNLEFGFKKFGQWSAEGRVFFMAHGDTDADSYWTLGDLDLAPSGDVTYTLDVGISGARKLSGPWEIWSGIDVIWTSTDGTDLQLYMGMSLSVL